MNYYNEFDKKTAAWLRQLIKEGLIPNGHVDERSIEDVRPSDLIGYTQCHFFAGIGGWSEALRIAGWPSDEPVWTGSCPCQPFSVAGQGNGVADERHLWPAFKWLIEKCKPATVFGEQVASKLGRNWLAGVRDDLEALGYDVGAADLCAAGVGAPHIRQRIWWVADSNSYSHGLQEIPDVSTLCSKTKNKRRTRRLSEVGGAAIWAEPCPTGASPVGVGNGVPCHVGLLRGYGNAIASRRGICKIILRGHLFVVVGFVSCILPISVYIGIGWW